MVPVLRRQLLLLKSLVHTKSSTCLYLSLDCSRKPSKSKATCLHPEDAIKMSNGPQKIQIPARSIVGGYYTILYSELTRCLPQAINEVLNNDKTPPPSHTDFVNGVPNHPGHKSPLHRTRSCSSICLQRKIERK